MVSGLASVDASVSELDRQYVKVFVVGAEGERVAGLEVYGSLVEEPSNGGSWYAGGIAEDGELLVQQSVRQSAGARHRVDSRRYLVKL